MEDLVLIVRKHLLADVQVSALVSGMVHGAHLIAPDEGTVEYPLVVVEMTTGTSSYTTYQEVTFYIWAYSRNGGGDALRIYDACHQALQHETIRNDSVAVAGYTVESERPSQGWNERARAFYAQGQYIMRAAYRSLS
jgi:hypothetical protein